MANTPILQGILERSSVRQAKRQEGQAVARNFTVTADNNGGSRLRDDAATVKISNEAQGRKLDLSQAQGELDKAQSAVASISKLKSQQLAIANEAKSLAQSKRTSDLNAEQQQLQSEIDRVESAAVDSNGASLLASSKTYFATSGDKITGVVARADYTSLLANSTIDLSTAAGAAAAANTLSGDYRAALVSAGGAKSAASKAESLDSQSEVPSLSVNRDSNLPGSEADLKEVVGEATADIVAAIGAARDEDTAVIEAIDYQKRSEEKSGSVTIIG